ncbi:TniQ family protein [Streptomyces sp. ALI-76-A]|uniref:TniQ family protein n=1 Tax=Streptomyces sp. ALI-76-A TaxID=3025736 RepID=UPI00256EB524|nr:TniQ family protein [Streptomyces sp. ALI-76-A]MDL5199702.1 TniQ family protein [Streptomyces sp. ALI-76-A]
MPLIAGETTASYLARTAAANALEHSELLRALQPRRRIRTPALRPAAEVYLSPPSLHLLADLIHRPADQLARALPHLRTTHLLEDDTLQVRSAAWPRGAGRGPLPGCPLCMEEGAWLVSFDRLWTPCGCGRRWLVGDHGGYLIDTTPLPELARALLQHRAFVHRLGPAVTRSSRTPTRSRCGGGSTAARSAAKRGGAGKTPSACPRASDGRLPRSSTPRP